jgi:uncharacterized protein YeaO (DUF488 family)
MAARIVRLGTARTEGEGVRIGTVRRPPRGVRKSDYASRNFYDVWFPTLAPTPSTVRMGLTAATPGQLARYKKRYLAEMKKPAARQALEVLAKLSHHANFSVGCYCEDAARCHRTLLRQLLIENGAKVE